MAGIVWSQHYCGPPRLYSCISNECQSSRERERPRIPLVEKRDEVEKVC